MCMWGIIPRGVLKEFPSDLLGTMACKPLLYCLVVYLPLWKMSKSVRIIIPNIIYSIYIYNMWNKVGQRTQKQNGTEQTIFSCMSGTALWAQAYDAIWTSFQKFPQAISTVSSRRASGLAPSQRSFPKPFPRLHPVEHPVSLPPSAVSPSYFHGFIPSSIRSRSLPAKFPQAISTASSRRASGLAPSQRSFPKLFPQAISTASSRRASGLAPSQRSFPKLFPRLHPVEHPVSLCPCAVSPSYFHGFIPSSIRSRSVPAQFPQAISTASSRRASGLAPSQRSFPKLFPQAISTASSRRASGLAPSQCTFPKLFPRLHPVEHPVSLPPSAVFPSYFHGFIPSSIRSRSLPAQFPQAISTASSRRASGLAPSQRSFPKLFPRLHPVEHPVSLPPSAVFPSYFHGFIPSSIRSRSLPAQFSQAISTASSRRASGLAPSQRSFPNPVGPGPYYLRSSEMLWLRTWKGISSACS